MSSPVAPTSRAGSTCTPRGPGSSPSAPTPPPSRALVGGAAPVRRRSSDPPPGPAPRVVSDRRGRFLTCWVASSRHATTTVVLGAGLALIRHPARSGRVLNKRRPCGDGGLRGAQQHGRRSLTRTRRRHSSAIGRIEFRRPAPAVGAAAEAQPVTRSRITGRSAGAASRDRRGCRDRARRGLTGCRIARVDRHQCVARGHLRPDR